MAPPRLVDLQNHTAAQKRGRRKARQVAWCRIDRPEVKTLVETKQSTRRWNTLGLLGTGDEHVGKGQLRGGMLKI